MFVIVASQYDDEAAELARSRDDVAVLTCADLSQPGWELRLDRPERSVAVVAGEVTPIEEIDGVLTRRPCVLPDELGHIAPEDRRYVAAESTAFLMSWLSLLPRPVLNPPSTTCLAGPSWRAEHWIWAAARIGLPVVPRRWVISVGSAGDAPDLRVNEPNAMVTVVGEQWFGDVPGALGRAAVELGRAAGTPLLGVAFDEPTRSARIVGATSWPPLDDQRVRDAIWAYLGTAPVAGAAGTVRSGAQS